MRRSLRALLGILALACAGFLVYPAFTQVPDSHDDSPFPGMMRGMDRAAEVQAWLEPRADEMAELLEELVALDTENPPGRNLGRCGARLLDAMAGLGLSLSRTVETFLRFREPFNRELAATARRRGFDTAETADMMVSAERAMDRVLVATMRGHDAAGASQVSRKPHPA